jgi:hypothetical protein
VPDILSPVRIYQLEAVVGDIVEHAGVAYKTKPKFGVVRQSGASHGQMVFKNHDVETVVAEALGSALADLVQLPVPPWGILEPSGSNHAWFGSEMQLRTHADDLIRRNQVMNLRVIADTLVFDAWTANDDRNMGGFVARIPTAGREEEVELLAIDFESCQLLRGRSVLMLNAEPVGKFRPRVEVRRHMTGMADPYRAMSERIAHLTEARIATAFDRLVIPSRGLIQPLPIPWRDSAVRSLANRATRIGMLVQEVIHAT